MSSNTMISLRPENVIRQLPWRLDSKAALGFLLILAIFSLVGWLYLTQASAVTATSYRIDELRVELDQIKNQNAALILEIAELEALSRVKTRARELGFEPTTNVTYLPVSSYPMPLELDQNYSNIPMENSVDAYVADVEQPNWWVEKLDAFAEWLEGREVQQVK
jgi:hypothetical protein